MSSTPDADGAGAPRPISKRHSPPADAARGSKRGKYTSVACDHCKKRKLKCLQAPNTEACQRCVDTGKTCVYSPTGRGGHGAPEAKPTPVDDVPSLSRKVASLQRDMALLADTVSDMKSQMHLHDRQSQTSSSHQGHVKVIAPKEAGFVGPTRSAFSIEIGERSLTRMGIPTYDEANGVSDPQSPESSSANAEDTLNVDFWQRCTVDEVHRLISIFEEEVGVVYPCFESTSLASQAAHILRWGRRGEVEDAPSPEVTNKEFGLKDFQLAKVAIATAIVTEEQGKNDHSNVMVESVERSVSRILKPASNLKDLQLLAALSIYYFHCGEDILAWRTIGLAGREALVMGLHQKSALIKTYKDEDERCLATRIFWCIYVLDRRWSFGTSLSFALVDADIDPELPEPGPDYEYLQCMVGYGRLCSSVWKAIVSFKTISASLAPETVHDLDTKTLAWLESIPMHLRLQHPRQGTAPRPQPVVLHRLRALLYLRGNHSRILIYRHHLLSPTRIKADPGSVWLVVEIAQDTIEVLVHLNATSNIYRRQQSAFNYFLLSALAVVFLAVCHNPAVYAERCRDSFHAAVKLVRDFSRGSKASRRLWDSIKGLLPRLQTLGLRSADDSKDAAQSQVQQQQQRPTSMPYPQRSPHGSVDSQTFPTQMQHMPSQQQQGQMQVQPLEGAGDMDGGSDLSGTTPNMFQVSNDLINLFNVMEQGRQLPTDMNMYQHSQIYGDENYMGESGEISRRFQGLI